MHTLDMHVMYCNNISCYMYEPIWSIKTWPPPYCSSELLIQLSLEFHLYIQSFWALSHIYYCNIITIIRLTSASYAVLSACLFPCPPACTPNPRSSTSTMLASRSHSFWELGMLSAACSATVRASLMLTWCESVMMTLEVRREGQVIGEGGVVGRVTEEVGGVIEEIAGVVSMLGDGGGVGVPDGEGARPKGVGLRSGEVTVEEV